MSKHVEYVTTQELAAILKKSPRTILRMTHDGDIPYIKVGGTYRYDPDEVREALKPTESSWKQSRRSTSRKRVA